MSKIGKNAVILAEVSGDFRPTTVSEIPQNILTATIHKDKLPLCTGIDFCRSYNAERLAAGPPYRDWALLVKWVRPLVKKGGAA